MLFKWSSHRARIYVRMLELMNIMVYKIKTKKRGLALGRKENRKIWLLYKVAEKENDYEISR